MREQIQRQRTRRDRDADNSATSETISTAAVDSGVSDAAECCLTDIDSALEDAACCVAEAKDVLSKAAEASLREAAEALRESSKPRPYSEWSDQERLDAEDPVSWIIPKRTEVLGEGHSMLDYLRARDLYDTSYQRLTGLSNQRDCGCGCG
jgi:hypothetical protein